MYTTLNRKTTAGDSLNLLQMLTTPQHTSNIIKSATLTNRASGMLTLYSQGRIIATVKYLCQYFCFKFFEARV